MNDILPADSARWEWFEDTVRRLLARYGYRSLRTPIVEPTALFVRGLGEVTDIVEKEMYSFEDSMNGDRLTLRPEATAGMVRAINEHNALYNGPLRVWQMGPMFRHERPQKGRYRQFHQLDVEAFGHAGPDVDAEIILMLRALWRELGLKEGSDVTLEINSLGQPDERKAHRAALIAYLEGHAELLDDDAKRRLHSNPLRILDTKNPTMQALVDGAPQLMDFLGEASLAHFDALRAVLDAAGLAYRVNPRLVRGMDYYNLTVFEWVTPHLGSQATVCGGGRYDQLIEQLGGKPAPGVGFGLGIERLLLLLDALQLQPPRRGTRCLCRGARPGGAAAGDAAAGDPARAGPGRGAERRRRQHEVAVQEGRCQRRALGPGVRRRRAGAWRSGREAAARRRCGAKHARAGRCRHLGG